MELTGCLTARSAVDLRHEEHFLPVALGQGLPHAALARAAVVIPGIVHERNPAIDGSPHQPMGKPSIHVRQRQMPSAQSDGGHHFARAAECSSRNSGGHGSILPAVRDEINQWRTALDARSYNALCYTM